MINYKNTYINLPKEFYQKINPKVSLNPKFVKFNANLANELDLNLKNNHESCELLSGSRIQKNSSPIAMAYAGHQFGQFVPQLGDGRAVLIGEILDSKNRRFDIQLKGSGKTKFSRGGDGKCPLDAAVREYILSEAMNSFNIPTTRSLAIISTGEEIMREGLKPGAILVRVASSHIRIGTFEYFSFRNDIQNLKLLADYSIERHFSDFKNTTDKYLIFFNEVMKKQINLICKWYNVGFIHGVMNTDNTTISGETIDYGPCAFMDFYKQNKVFSSIDYSGRYSFNNQIPVIFWNLNCLANCLAHIFNKEKWIVRELENLLNKFPKMIKIQWLKVISSKFGLIKKKLFDEKFILQWLEILEKNNLDYTNSFTNLFKYLENNNLNIFPENNEIKDFLNNWKKKLSSQNIDINKVKKIMKNSNPIYIPRNHLVESAITATISGDFSKMNKLLEILEDPYVLKKNTETYQQPPTKSEEVLQTFCGT